MITGQNYLNWSCVRCRQSDSQEAGSDRDYKTQHSPIFFFFKEKEKGAFTQGVLLSSPCIPALCHNHHEKKGLTMEVYKATQVKVTENKNKTEAFTLLEKCCPNSRLSKTEIHKKERKKSATERKWGPILTESKVQLHQIRFSDKISSYIWFNDRNDRKLIKERVRAAQPQKNDSYKV